MVVEIRLGSLVSLPFPFFFPTLALYSLFTYLLHTASSLSILWFTDFLSFLVGVAAGGEEDRQQGEGGVGEQEMNQRFETWSLAGSDYDGLHSSSSVCSNSING